MQQLEMDCAAVDVAMDKGEVPNYPTFVKNLMKDGDTAAEEFAHSAMGLVGEAAEVSEIAKKVRYYDKVLPHDKLLEEMGDLRFYYQALLNEFGLTDEMVVAQNVKKLRVRYASGKFSTEQANARADKAEGKVEEPRKFMSDTKPTAGLYSNIPTPELQKMAAGNIPVAERVRAAQVDAGERAVVAGLERKLGAEALQQVLEKSDPDTVGDSND
jgi:phosphoribosyl-ATP pyrophosphohydrolase